MRNGSLKTGRELEYMREAGQVVAQIHRALIEATAPGVTTGDLDAVVAGVIAEAGAQPNFLNYQGFPANVCISVNEEVVHGIPGDRVLREGDLVSYDCGAYVTRGGRQWHGDAAVSVVVGEPFVPDSERPGLMPTFAAEDELTDSQQRLLLSEITRSAMWAGVAAVANARRVGDIGAAVEDEVDALGAHLPKSVTWHPELIEGYTGHGIGNHMHEDPTVYNYRTRGRTAKIHPGMAMCIEPMVIAGDPSSAVLDDGWTVVTLSGNPAAHWEHTVAVGEAGISVLTSPDAGAAALARYGITPVRNFAA